MQNKSLLAIAVLSTFAATAQAQSNVAIGGIVQANIKSYSIGNTTRVVQRETRIDDDYTSRFWLTGKEDLGGGNTALFYIQNRLNTDASSSFGDGNGLGNGDTYLGFKGGWGQATIGKHTMMDGEGSATEKGGNGTPAIPVSMYGTKSILSYVGDTGLTVSRVVNSVLYKSPKFSGFSFAVGVGTSGSNGNEGTNSSTSTCQGPGTSVITLVSSNAANCTAAGGTFVTPAVAANYSDGSQFFLKGNYANGPVYLNVAYWSAKTEGRPATVTASTADQEQVRLSGSYSFASGFKVGLQYDRATLSNVGRVAGVGGADRKRSAWEVPVSYTFGPNTLLASYTKAGDYSNTANSGAKMYVLGYDYALSKRTNVGVFYSMLKNDTAGIYQPYKTGSSPNGSKLVAGESASILALGIKHTF